MSDSKDIEKGVLRALAEDSPTDELRINRGFWLCIIGVGCLSLLIVIMITAHKTAQDIVSISGILTGLLGTMIGAIFGVEVGSGETDRERKKSARAEMRYNLLWNLADETTKKEYWRTYGESFKTPKVV